MACCSAGQSHRHVHSWQQQNILQRHGCLQRQHFPLIPPRLEFRELQLRL